MTANKVQTFCQWLQSRNQRLKHAKPKNETQLSIKLIIERNAEK
jgi:hypothetical protein